MSKADSEEPHDPSDLAIKNAHEIGSLSAVTRELAGDLLNIGRDMKEGFARTDRNIERISAQISKPPNVNLWVGTIIALMGLMVTAVVGGIPLIAALIYFVVTSTVAPLNERLGKVEQSEQAASEHAWDNFELLIRDDQTLVDSAMKINDTDTAMKSEQNAKKLRKKKPPSK